MAGSFFFYDLETSGINPREARIMQFAGQRTDENLKPIGDPVKLPRDVLPDPEAVLLTGITPQQTQAEGVSEAEFLRLFESEVNTPGTIFVGFNTVRFDDEFIRYLRYRNFYDPYDWQWKNGCSRWDLLDLTRMTRALRPDGIEWPFTEDGEPTCRLELITALNGLDHAHAHDALNDVLASIALAELIRSKQPKLFDYVLEMRDKKKVRALVDSGKPFIYTSGKYNNGCQKTAVVAKLANHPGRQGALVYDLRFNPADYVNLSPQELADIWRWNKNPKAKKLPVKTLQFNRCPAVAPLGVVMGEDGTALERIGTDASTLRTNLATLQAAEDFPGRVLQALQVLEDERMSAALKNLADVDARLYDGFLADRDAGLLAGIRQADPAEIMASIEHLQDKRLRELLPRYKARNFPDSLDEEERTAWEAYVHDKLFAGDKESLLAQYFKRLETCAADPKYVGKEFLLEELQLYGQGLLPVEAF
jgi:exodeoxyribonuclease-1